MRIIRPPEKLVLTDKIALSINRSFRGIHDVPEVFSHIFAGPSFQGVEAFKAGIFFVKAVHQVADIACTGFDDGHFQLWVTIKQAITDECCDRGDELHCPAKCKREYSVCAFFLDIPPVGAGEINNPIEAHDKVDADGQVCVDQHIP